VAINTRVPMHAMNIVEVALRDPAGLHAAR